MFRVHHTGSPPEYEHCTYQNDSPHRQARHESATRITIHGEQGWNAPTKLRELVDGLTRLRELGRTVSR